MKRLNTVWCKNLVTENENITPYHCIQNMHSSHICTAMYMNLSLMNLATEGMVEIMVIKGWFIKCVISDFKAAMQTFGN